MALSPETFPLTHSLRDWVQERFAPTEGGSTDSALPRQELVAYLAGSIDTDSSPLATIRRRAAREGRSADLAPADQAVLAWVSEAFNRWEEDYALESPLREQIRKLQPLAVAVALQDEDFYYPGRHPLHQLLDTLQRGAVGWQARLDRAGQMLEQRVERAVEKALEWFRHRDLDLAAITAEVEAANERDAARAERMVQRLAETEEARLRTLNAKHMAAQHINEVLADFELPSAIGDFLRGPWYDSAQLVLVKHSENSGDWQEMQRATRHLAESVQPLDPDDDVESDRRSQILRRLPAELRRWLLSLEHDSEGTDSAIGLVEYAHLRMQHGQVLQLVRVAGLPVEDQGDNEDRTDEVPEIGQWYHFEDGDLRAQLVLQLERGDHLLFTNFVGLKAIDLPMRAFKQRLADGFVQALPNLRTFSICLAGAVGINSEEDLRALTDPNYQRPAAEPQEMQEFSLDESASTSQDADTEPGGTPEPSTAPEATAQDEELELTLDPEEETPRDTAQQSQPVSEPPPEPESPQIPQEVPTDDPPPDQAPATPAQPQPASEPPPAQTQPPFAQTEPASEPPAQPVPAPAPPPAGQPPAPPPPAAQPPAPAAPQTPPAVPPEQPYAPATAPPAAAPPQYAPPPPPPPTPAPTPTPLGPSPAAPAAPTGPTPEVPMGAWLGFHDGETPIMAKLAVYDPRRDSYIFVNRRGIAMRELSGNELRALMDQDLVDVLEARSNFRDQVARAREEGQ